MEITFLRATRRLRFSHTIRRLQHSSSKPPSTQANPIGDYYAALLESPTPEAARSSPNVSFTVQPAASPEAPDPKPSILFSGRLSSPLERRNEIQKKSTLVAGVWVPPRPDEPDDCCMSGCVNCVWDRYGEELEEWAAARKKADAMLQKDTSIEKMRKKQEAENARTSSRGSAQGSGLMLGEGEDGASHTMTSMDDDGGGSEGLWGSSLDADTQSEELFKGVPVGIREFMKQEKKLREKHARQGTSGG